MRTPIQLGTATLVALLAGVVCPIASAASASGKLGFNRDIRPILSDNCFYCHGPDKHHRDGKFRLDERDSAVAKKAIVPGKPADSSLVERIFTTDTDDLMPPPKTHKKLSAAQKEILKRWIVEGAEYEPYWAYIVPTRPAVPKVSEPGWVRTPIDAFILEALDQAHLKHSPEADKRTLLRRLSLDLIGLPPTSEEMDAFLSDKSPEAYEKQVDRLLASPHYGERMAVPWLDAVRFADTVGFHGDQNQNVFPYRDYVIDAFNHNKPFDQFTAEQLAGDLLPHPTAEQLTATCFVRLTMMTREGGAQPKEYLAKYAADRVRTIGNAWLGSTLNCCECHDHKFDPFTTRDFYSMESFFADVKQWGVYMDYKYTPNPDLKGFSNESPFPPEIVVDSPYLHQREKQLTDRLDKLALEYAQSHQSELEAWRKKITVCLESCPGWAPLAAVPKENPAKTQPAVKRTKAAATPKGLQLMLPAGPLSAIKVELHPDRKAKPDAGKKRRGASGMVEFAAVLKTGKSAHKIEFFHADADRKQERYLSGHAIIGVLGGWELDETNSDRPESAVYLLAKPVDVPKGAVLEVSFGSVAVADAKIYVSGLAPIKPLEALPVDALPAPRIDAKLARAFLLSAATIQPETLAEARKIERDIYECRDGKSPVMVVQAVTPRPMRILRRGNWQDEGGDVVKPTLPVFLTQSADASAEPSERRLTRLDLARWLTSPRNPLTSRAIVNRLWKQFFGAGLSANVDDLGAQGEPPSHPELLDWLAVEFRDPSTLSTPPGQAPSAGSGHGWDFKHLIKLMVMSSVYRQDSNLRPELEVIDPQNRLLSSQNPRRLEAEFVRDNALCAAGLLNLDLGGPSVFPYQPEGYYANIQFPNRKYIASTDDRQFRRGIYMHWQRTFLHPMLANFDAPSREDAVCTRTISNTPQQALTLLNDPEFVEAARALAQKAIASARDDSGRLEFIYQHALDRSPRQNESESIKDFLAEQREYFSAHKDDAAKLVHTGISPVAPGADEVDLAEWTMGCRVVLNLHETITRY
jgi:hypothetical protein